MQRVPQKKVVDLPQVEPWERISGEPAEWFDRFDRYYCPKGPGRTLLGAYNEWRMHTHANKAKAQSPSRGWWNNSKKWLWQIRAEAWDAQQRQVRQVHEQGLAREAREQRRTLLMGLVGKIAEGLTAFDPTGLELGELVSATTAVVNELRKEYDEEPPRRVDINTTGPGVGNTFAKADIFLDGLDEAGLGKLLEVIRAAKALPMQGQVTVQAEQEIQSGDDAATKDTDS